MRRGELGTLTSLTSIGRWLIGVRIANVIPVVRHDLLRR